MRRGLAITKLLGFPFFLFWRTARILFFCVCPWPSIVSANGPEEVAVTTAIAWILQLCALCLCPLLLGWSWPFTRHVMLVLWVVLPGLLLLGAGLCRAWSNWEAVHETWAQRKVKREWDPLPTQWDPSS